MKVFNQAVTKKKSDLLVNRVENTADNVNKNEGSTNKQKPHRKTTSSDATTHISESLQSDALGYDNVNVIRESKSELSKINLHFEELSEKALSFQGRKLCENTIKSNETAIRRISYFLFFFQRLFPANGPNGNWKFSICSDVIRGFFSPRKMEHYIPMAPENF